MSRSYASSWDDLKQQSLDRVMLPLSVNAHKGSSGRVAVLGGSALYTGAPYYAAMASLKAGADLAYVLTAPEAALPIKCYSPELMVAPVYSATDFTRAEQQEEVDERQTQAGGQEQQQQQQLVDGMVKEVMSQIGRAHCLVIGPGLGRSPLVFQATERIIQEAKEMGLHLVLDADALFMLSLPQYQSILQGYDKAILAPNAMEYKRLFAQQQQDEQQTNSTSSPSPFQDVTIVRKAQQDIIEVNGRTQYICEEQGGLKRSGGIGDVLAGTLGALVSWKAILDEQSETASSTTTTRTQSSLALSCWTACCFVKHATARAYHKKKRAMTAPDVLEELGPAIDEMTTTSTESSK